MNHKQILVAAPAIHRNASRRLFLRQASAMSVLAGTGAPLALNLLAAGSAAAQSAPDDYRAVVCLFMVGGNDSFNTVLPTDPTSWSAYKATRGSIALMPVNTPAKLSEEAGSPARLGGVLPIAPINAQGRTFALHPLLGSLQNLFNTEKRLAIVSNIGPLIKPTTKAQLDLSTHPRPARLFSHNDQQSTWQTTLPEGAGLSSGWGGRMADMIAANQDNAVFTAISVSGGRAWLTGTKVRQYAIAPDKLVPLGAINDDKQALYGSKLLPGQLHNLVSNLDLGAHVLEADLASVSKSSIQAEAFLRGALASPSDARFGTQPDTVDYIAAADKKLMFLNPVSGEVEFNSLAHQLQAVARLVDAGMSRRTGVSRQVFFVSLDGFDTHSGQNQKHAVLLAKLNHAMSYFDTALAALGALNNVTTFTASDFGRGFTSNGDGTDHGWGGHHFVMGGAVRGGNLYGTFPTMVAGNSRGFYNSPDQVRNGALLPTTSVDQLGATLGRWFGLTEPQYQEVFPNLKNDFLVHNLGFMS